MFLLNLLLPIAVLLAFGQTWAEARIAPIRPAKTTKTLLHDISLYTKEHFLDNALYGNLPCNSCLFYTFSLTATAQRYAKGSKMEMVTIWDIWPSGYYNGDIDDDANPLAGIFASRLKTRKYYENMSAAMAQLCGGFATVMTKDTSNIPLDGIWGMSELPTLKRGGRRRRSVHTVVAVDPTGDKSKTVWEHPKHDLENCEAKVGSLSKRQGMKRYTPDQLEEWFAEVPF